MSSAADQGNAVRERTREKSGILYGHKGGLCRVSPGPSPELVEEVDVEKWRRRGADLDTQFTESLPELSVPGGGEERETCGDPWPDKFCDRCGSPVYVGHLCDRYECPRCWEHSARNGAVEITARLKGRLSYEKTKLSEGRKLGLKAHHVVASPPQEFVVRRSDPLEAGYEIAKEMMGEVGADEGVIVYHPYRIRKEHRDEVMGHDSGDGDKTWKDILHLVEEQGFQAVRDEYLVFNPHFHCIVLSEFVLGGQMTANLNDRSGWVVHRIAGEDGASIRDMYDLASVGAYSLSHAGLSETADDRKQAEYRYFGEVSNFEPTDGVRADAKIVVNSITERVLGMSFGSGPCTEPAEQVGNVGDADRELPDDFEVNGDYCNGRMTPMHEATDYLGDPEWVEGAPRSGELFLALREWIGLAVVDPLLDSTGLKPPP